jgi:hypothetical protein
MKLANLLTEAIKKLHFDQRVYDRLKSEYTNFTTEDPTIQREILNSIDFLSRVNFMGQDNVAILIYKGHKWYKYEKPADGKMEKSEGNYIWSIIRGNELETIVFGDAAYKPLNTQYLVKISNLMHYITDKKHGDFNITSKDLHNLVSYNPNQQAAEIKDKEPVFIINSVKWILTADKQYLVKKNNPNEKMSVDDAIKLLPDPQAEALLNLL